MDLENLKQAVKAIGWLSLGAGIAGLLSMVSIIMINVFAQQVNNGNIELTNSANETIQTQSSNITTYITTFIGLLSLVAGLGSLVIVVLAMLGKVNFVKMSGYGGSGKKKMF